MNTFKLQVEAGEQAGEVFALNEGENVLGRSREVQIHLTSADVSSRHARLTVQGQKVFILNLSQYGTMVGERKLAGSESVQLEPGQLVRVGKNTLRLQEISEKSADERASGLAPAKVLKKNVSPTVVPETNKPAPGQAAMGAPVKNTGIDETKDDFAQADRSTNGGISKDFDETMRARAENADLEEPDGGASSDKTFVQKTVFAPKEELDRRLAEERKKDRYRLLAIMGGSILALTLLFVFWPKQNYETKLELDNSYDDGLVSAPQGGFKISYPKNSSSKVESAADGVVVSTQLGHKRDVRQLITLQESVADKWATQDSDKSLHDWMESHPELTFGLPHGRFEGEQNGVWVWNVSYTRSGPETAVGEARVFFNGRQLEAMFSEVPAVDQGRAESMYRDNTYFDFPTGFEATCWAGQAVTTKAVPTTAFIQIRDDLQREAPLTWAAINRQLRQILSQSVLDKNADNEAQALSLLASLRQQQTLWYNSQVLLFVNARHAGDAKGADQIAQRCQAVFSDQNDNRYFEVRKW